MRRIENQDKSNPIKEFLFWYLLLLFCLKLARGH